MEEQEAWYRFSFVSVGISFHPPREINDCWGTESEANRLAELLERDCDDDWAVDHRRLRDDEIAAARLGGEECPGVNIADVLGDMETQLQAAS